MQQRQRESRNIEEPAVFISAYTFCIILQDKVLVYSFGFLLVSMTHGRPQGPENPSSGLSKPESGSHSILSAGRAGSFLGAREGFCGGWLRLPSGL